MTSFREANGTSCRSVVRRVEHFRQAKCMTHLYIYMITSFIIYIMNPMNTLADRALRQGRLVHAAQAVAREQAVNSAMGSFIPPPFVVSPGRLIDSEGTITERFACVVHMKKLSGDEIAADGACAVIDLIEELGIEELRAAHARALVAKRLEKTEVHDEAGRPVATVTMALIFAHRTTCTVEAINDELQRLNENLPHHEWVDMVAISDLAALSYGCQLAGQQSLGGIMPPAKSAHGLYSPAMYTIPTMQASGEGTLNKVISFIICYLKFCDPDVNVPNFNDYLEGVCKTVVTSWGYQYNVAGDGRLENVRSDNGPEFTSRRVLGWAEDWKVALVHIQPGRPTQNGHVESFHGRLRDECLNASWFRTLGDVREKLADWQQEYNHERPHSSLDYRTPAEFRATLNLQTGYGDVESKVRFPHPHSPDDGCEMRISKQNQTQKTPVMNG
jgi:hypothetical protein